MNKVKKGKKEKGGRQMVKCKGLVMALCLVGILGLAATPAQAAFIDVFYYWYTGGTKAMGDESWVIGDISGTAIAKVEEYWATGTDRLGPVPSEAGTLNQFLYHPHPLGGGTPAIYDFKVSNPYGITGAIIQTPTGWTFSGTTADYWYWSTTTSPITNGFVYTFGIYTSAPRGLVSGEISDSSSIVTASGRVSGPVPEPTSLLLLGSGLLGVALLGVRKRKI